MKSTLAMVLLVVGTTSTAHALNKDGNWRITQPQWTEQHEYQFGQFVTQLGMAVENRKCATVRECLKSPANMYYGTDPKELKFFADCADLPYFLRAYFAWKNELPFSNATGFVANPAGPEDFNKDIRYSTNGNSVKWRKDVLTGKNAMGRAKFPNAIAYLNSDMINTVSTASYRMIGDNPGASYTDFYSARLDRVGIRPGTVIYDPNGHVAIVYRVTESGRILYIDAHPDNTLTMGLYTSKFMRSVPGQGAGFKNFRPLMLEGASQDSSGALIGGRIIAAENRNLAAYGTEQYYGSRPDGSGDWKKSQFIFNGQAINYYEYVQLKLTNGEPRIDPLMDMKFEVIDICSSLKDRVAAVELARRDGIPLKPHPERLPVNIFGATGEWESYATPSRDARLKTSFVDILAQAQKAINKHRAGDRMVRYNGGNLAKDLFAVYANEATLCKFSYTTSNRQTLLMNLEAARQRLYNMSFDPYHCPEMRWGARKPQELQSCTDDQNKRAWFDAERWLRNQIERRYDVRMDYTVDQLGAGPKPGVGTDTAPDIDIVTYLKSQM
ncbi:hypothetical protein B9G69_011185 [Bdellovibrio sp. SKB1291214]|uniref:hypothetical protein n=1 Tax=Bdellovibrio sp. SKB1291214 TaxID=1732569 RepID=UPI000B5179F3|nr:hypothetical protein [Bdellovibrio sp. SKB1291214]UYL07609.1 hypothetical protein B9G69_011185 [Bdellovibrio sp. SKB1291214]